MKITLIDYTGNGHENKRFAADLLAFTKSTRLKMSPDLFNTIQEWDDETMFSELLYMSNTIPSSWEFIDYTFLLEDCTRAFTHQLVRNRHGSYAQQTMRILDVSGFGYEIGPSIENNQDALEKYCDMMNLIDSTYNELQKMEGVEIEDARGILPTNIHTNIICKFNLRTLSEIVSKRSSSRTQGEYRDFVNEIADSVIKVHPWFDVFLRNKKHESANKLDEAIQQCWEDSAFGRIDSKDSVETKMNLLKMVDILRG